jgi:2-polyprenyl-3-methyl-5-hydroxy-6-metoxy-1,4-benzoquinol methylase
VVKEKNVKLQTATPHGLHEFVAASVLTRYARPGIRAADLGAGPGAMSERLAGMGCSVVAVDRDPDVYKAGFPFVTLDFNAPDFAASLGIASFGLVVAIEVIEHLESPIGFLRNIREVLVPGGVAVITTPNVDSLPARAKFLLTGKIRTMDTNSDPTHISPIFSDLLLRQFLPRTRLKVREHRVFPPNGFQLTRKPLAGILRVAAAVFPGDLLVGDHHILVLEAAR